MTTGKTFRDVLDRELRTDPEFRKEWQRTQIAREVALQVVRYRAKLVALRSGLKAQVHAVMAKEGVLPGVLDMFGPGGNAQPGNQR